ncbi:MAG: YdcF family protein [Betaproteobacteria bacterium]|nr:YdcF family protein [Betaproteobacteria bacterium]MBI2961751.1 YdcF family protein [Betaproteobacteria bacterium]
MPPIPIDNGAIMHCFRRCALAFLFLAAGGTAAAIAAVFLISDWLTRADQPAPASAIVVLGGDPTRALEAAELYRAGLAPRVFITAPIRARFEQRLDRIGVPYPREEDLTRQVLVRNGVPDSAITLLGRDLVSTAQEAAALRRKLGESGSALVVTSPYHVGRSRLIIGRELARERFRVLGSRFEPFPDPWWGDREAARNVILESAKFVFFVVGGRF